MNAKGGESRADGANCMVVEGGRLQFLWQRKGALGWTKRALNNAEGGRSE